MRDKESRREDIGGLTYKFWWPAAVKRDVSWSVSWGVSYGVSWSVSWGMPWDVSCNVSWVWAQCFLTLHFVRPGDGQSSILHSQSNKVSYNLHWGVIWRKSEKIKKQIQTQCEMVVSVSEESSIQDTRCARKAADCRANNKQQAMFESWEKNYRWKQHAASVSFHTIFLPSFLLACINRFVSLLLPCSFVLFSLHLPTSISLSPLSLLCFILTSSLSFFIHFHSFFNPSFYISFPKFPLALFELKLVCH